jgi:calcineurin-like phosphoesterase family protein
MINVWFTSDLHLGHRNIIRYCNRPFDSVEDMDATLLANLNSKVRETDILYFLGDFCLGGADQARLYRDRIICRNIHMIEGNHDPTLRELTGAFCSWNQMAEIRAGGQRIVLCHYAMRVWHHSSRGVWHFYGHSHGKLPDDPTSLSIDVGVDSHDFRPWHFHEIRTVMETKRRARELRDEGPKGDQQQT